MNLQKVTSDFDGLHFGVFRYTLERPDLQKEGNICPLEKIFLIHVVGAGYLEIDAPKMTASFEILGCRF